MKKVEKGMYMTSFFVENENVNEVTALLIRCLDVGCHNIWSSNTSGWKAKGSIQLGSIAASMGAELGFSCVEKGGGATVAL